MISIAFAALTAATAAAADPAGYSPLQFEAPHHGRAVTGAIWYPAGGKATPIVYAENPVFHGVTVMPDAPVLEGTHPVVLLSHGMGGHVRSLAWLASALAEKGAIVIGVNHPNSTWGDFDIALGLRHWTRAQDLSLAFDTILADQRFEGRFDMDRIMAAGFSYGGWTALSLAGLRSNHAGYVAHCEEYGSASSHCDDVMATEIRFADVSAETFDADYTDQRVTHAVGIDPALVWGLHPDNLEGMIDNVSLIGLGQGDHRLLATDFDTSGFAGMVPDAAIDRIGQATHFSALPLCKPMAEAILAEEKDDPVCTDPEGTDRKAVHDAIIDRIAADLNL